MGNEEKILQMLEQMGGQIDQVGGQINQINVRLDKMDSRLDKMDSRLDKMDVRLDKIDGRLDRLEADMAEVKEHAEVTRSATNSLVEWADTVGVITQVRFPIEKANQQ